ncbi:MAG: dihydroorotate dehydrogenase [Dialister sp.]|nr:dihydroorotate dehydrogenase [Dialister sp.]
MKLDVDFLGIHMKSPVIAASGTFGFGLEYEEYMDLNRVGAISCKGLSLSPWAGNEGVRIAETSSGILNCIGLENPGVEYFKINYLPRLKRYDVPIICNVVGKDIEEYGKVAKALSVDGVHALEINISCPNVKHGGISFGTDSKMAYEVTRVVKQNTNLPVIMKLSPNVTDIVSIAKAVEEAGADAISLINTLMGLAIDAKTRKPVLGNITGGLSGPAIKPIALYLVWKVCQVVHVPVCGLGGIMTGKDVAEFMIAGACTVQVGTASIASPDAIPRITRELGVWCDENHVEDINDIIGTLQI